MIKYAFFDVDGTISSPCFRVNDRMVIGTDDDSWARYCREMGEDGYRWCRPIPEVGAYAERLKEKGARLFLLTAASSEEEIAAKWKFAQTNFPGLFEKLYAVRHDAEKCPFLLQKAEEFGVKPEECELVEDTFRILLETIVKGIRSTHVTTILTGLTDQLYAEQ